MKNVNTNDEVSKLAGMYFDQALDPQSKADFLQKVDSDPAYLQAFQHEQSIREHLKKNIHRPVNSSQLTQAIKNQIRHHK
jgi:hypothetical protein